MRAVDWEGAIRVQRSRALVRTATAPRPGICWQLVGRPADRQRPRRVPGLFLIYERHVVDLSGVENLEQALALAASELDGLADDAPVALIGVPPGRWFDRAVDRVTRYPLTLFAQ